MGKRLSSKLNILVIMIMILNLVNTSIVEAGQCVRVARDCIEPGGTRTVHGASVYKDCWRYKDAYKCTGYAANNCREFDDSPDCYEEESSCKQKVGNWCVAQNRTYSCETEEKFIRKEKRYKAPTFQKKNFEERKRVVCGEKIRCIDGKCFNMQYPANDEIAEAGGMLDVMKEMQGEGVECDPCPDGQAECIPDPKTCRVFRGELHKCMQVKGQWVSYAVAAAAIYFAWTAVPVGLTPGAGVGATGTKLGAMTTMDAVKFAGTQLGKVGLASLAKVDCCGMNGMLAPLCSKDSMALQSKLQQKHCYKVGKYKHTKLKGVVITTSYCCFNSEMAYEIQTQARSKGLISRGWGDAKQPDCKGLSIEELQNMDWGQIEFDFLTEKLKTEVLWDKMGSMENAMKHTENLLSGEITAIQTDVAQDAEKVEMTEDALDGLNEAKLFEKKLDERHDDPSTQKAPDGRDKTKDREAEEEVEYRRENYKNRDKKGL